MNSLTSIWTSLAGRYTEDIQLITNYWSEITQAYTEKDRYYHNLDHVQYMIDLALKHQTELADSDTVLFAIFYHDIIYRTGRKDNEVKSAQLAAERLSILGFPAAKLDRCRQQIIATREHRDTGDGDTNYLLDFDLAILGDTPQRYLAYSRSIRKEYNKYPNFLYKRGRRKVLQHFLAMSRIFKTDTFYRKLETSAKANLQAELTRL